MPHHADAGPHPSVLRHLCKSGSDREADRLPSRREQFQLSSSAAKNRTNRFGVRGRWRQKATSQPTSRLPWPRAAGSSASSSCPGGRRTVSGTWPISAPILAAAFSRSNRSGGSRSASTNPSIRCSASSGTISDIQGKSRSFWPATRPCGASRRCCPPKGARSHGKMAQYPSDLPMATLVAHLSLAYPDGTTSRTDTRRGLALVSVDDVVASLVVRERGADGIKRPSHGAAILGHPQALVCRDALRRVLPTRQPPAAAA